MTNFYALIDLDQYFLRSMSVELLSNNNKMLHLIKGGGSNLLFAPNIRLMT